MVFRPWEGLYLKSVTDCQNDIHFCTFHLSRLCKNSLSLRWCIFDFHKIKYSGSGFFSLLYVSSEFGQAILREAVKKGHTPTPPLELNGHIVFRIFFLSSFKKSSLFLSGQALTLPPPLSPLSERANKKYFFCGFPNKRQLTWSSLSLRTMCGSPCWVAK